MRKRGLLILLVFLLLLSSIPTYVEAVDVWKEINQSDTILFVYIRGSSYLANGTAPWDPLNDSTIVEVSIHYPLNETHYRELYYNGKTWKEYTDKFIPGSPWSPTEPFTLLKWNLSKVLIEYQWGLKEYLPNISTEGWDGYVYEWEVWINASVVKITLYQHRGGEYDSYVTFKCRQNNNTVACQWGKPVLKTYPGRPPIGKETTESKSTAKEKNKICGPALIALLSLVPTIKRRR